MSDPSTLAHLLDPKEADDALELESYCLNEPAPLVRPLCLIDPASMKGQAPHDRNIHPDLSSFVRALMPYRTPSRKRLRSLCAEVHADDGSDPRVFFRKDGSRGKPCLKAWQLCRQVTEVLDSLLQDLLVVTVEPAPDATRLLVTVTPRSSDEPNDPAAILASLDRASGWLRGEVAAAITRKRAPLLVYRVVEIRSGSGGLID